MNTEAPTPPEGYEMFVPVAGDRTDAVRSYRKGVYVPWNSMEVGTFSNPNNEEFWFCRPIQELIPADIPISKPSPPESILQEAERLIHGDRQQCYGDAYESFNRIAKLWSDYKGVKITPKDVACMMILMKVSRSVTSSKRDNWTDMAGYAALGADIEAHEAAPE